MCNVYSKTVSEILYLEQIKAGAVHRSPRHEKFRQSQKNCSIKNEDELAQIIGNYRVTPDYEWLQFKAGIENRIQKSALKDENSNSVDSLEYQTVEPANKEIEEDSPEVKIQNTDVIIEDEMNSEKEVENSVIDKMASEETVTTVQYNFSETVEETEILATDSITESVDIRISPRNSTVELISFDSADSFPTEFSLVADVKIQMDDFEPAKEIPSLETPSKNCVTSNGIADEAPVTSRKTVTFEDDCDNLLDEKIEFSETESNTFSPYKVVNCAPKIDIYSSNNNVPNSEGINGQKVVINGGKRDTKKASKGVSFTVESKIAQEIKEMKQREEDLRKMREVMAKEISNKPEINATVHTNGPKIEQLSKRVVEKTISNEVPKTLNAKTQVVNGQNYKIASVFGRKDTSKRTENSNKVEKKPSATYESPIEKEIRIVKQREEELKKEREQALLIKQQLESCALSTDLSDDDKETNDTFASVSICSDSSFDSGTKLTSPDQKTFDDSMSPTSINNKINGFYCNSSNAASTCSLDSISQSEKSTSFNGLQKVFSQLNNQIRTPSPDSSSNSSISKISFPFNGQKPGLVAKNKNVNMERFIASKGKQIVFKNSSPINSAVGNAEYFEIKPPQIKKSDQMSQRKFISAASKIQSELNEMKEREEELRKERARVLGMNGNLSDLTPETIDTKQNSDSSTDICSSPDFLETDKDLSTEIEKEENPGIHTRRRSSLIEEWERRIQKTEVQV
ncbi:hypothetical protein JTE90_004446 [Oedothorax gibbosus]|uniref:A-kinase anchor protein 2 C-terminal domain-containing protein n=1 Tax=Oedothorax gibbosus TaxID=931172 RepID=A0AAV6UQW0_9ARAC|nr:hypothetical protein JTE90_004446 [Oedothorax gibbosus]